MKALARSTRITLFIVSMAILPALMIVGAPTVAGAATTTAVQSGDVGTGALASGAVGTVLPANATLGDTIVLAVLTGQPVASVTSPMGTFVKVNASHQSGQSDIELWVLSGVTGVGRTVTVTISGGSAWYAQATEFSGTLNAVANAPTTGTSTGPNGSVTTSANDVAVLYVNGLNNSLSSGPGTPWVNYNAGAFQFAWDESVSYQVLGASGTVTGTWAQSASAKWQVIGLSLSAGANTTHTVTFNANGGTGTMSPEVASSPTALSANTFTFAGHTFTGWNTAANATGTAYANGATYPFSADVTLYAQWSAAVSHTVTFNANGGGGTMANQVASSPTALSANTFTYAGHSFTGWNTAANATGTAYAGGATYPFSADVILYAQWTTVTNFSAVGNFVTTGNSGITTANATLTKAGDLLVIWVKSRFTSNPQIHVLNISASGTGAIGTPVNAVQYYTVDHPGNDDEIWYVPITSAGTVTLAFTWSGVSSSDFNEFSTQEFQPSTPSIYSLDTTNHFESNASSLTMQFPSLTPVGAGELYAGYNSNNTSGVYTGPTAAGYTVDDTADTDAILFNPGVSASLQSPFTTATSNPSTQSSIGALIVATPAASHTVTFNANGGTGTMSPEVASSPTALNANTFTFAGHTFTGWNTAANATGTAYAGGATYPFSADVILYAQWSAGAATTAVQSGDVGTGALASGAVGTVLPANATLGDTIVLAVLTGQPVASVTSPMGTFVKVNASHQSGQSDIELWVLSGVTGVGRTVTVTISGGSAWYAQATEFSGTLNAVANAPTTGTSTGPNGSVTTSANDVAVLYVNGLNNSLSSGPGTPWVNYNAGAFQFAWDESVSYQVLGASGTVTGTWAQSASAKWQVIGLSLSAGA